MTRGLLFATLLACAGTTNAEDSTRILIVVGPSTHPPGTHEVAAGARLVKHCLETSSNVPGLHVSVVDGWPTDAGMRSKSASIVFVGDTFPPMRLPGSKKVMSELGGLMDQGVGIVCIHYATGLRTEDVADDGEHPLLHWMGGYFATRCKHHQSVAKVLTTTITPSAGAHPVLRGWKAFTLEDEPYYFNYFGPNGPGPKTIPFATAMLPLDDPSPQIVAWGAERPDGGRGMGIVMPHFYRSWKIDDLRRVILNGIVWSARREVPTGGVASELPDLARFEPASVEPIPKPPAKASTKAKVTP